MAINPRKHSAWLVIACFLIGARAQTVNPDIPHLEKHGTTMRLIVNGKPFLMLGAELHNSSSSSLEYMRPEWPRLASIPQHRAHARLLGAPRTHRRTLRLYFGRWPHPTSAAI